MIQNPKTFFEQFQNFIEESGLQLKKFKSNLSNYFTKAEAIDTFLGKTDKAESAKKADEATKATQDASGNIITSTYATKTEVTKGLAGKASMSHTHTSANVTDLNVTISNALKPYATTNTVNTELAKKANESHTHTVSQITDMPNVVLKVNNIAPASGGNVNLGLHAVATSGDYNDLRNKPSMPATPNAYITETWRDGAQWYRKWSDGLIEQGGKFWTNSAYPTMTFNTPFSNTNYSISGWFGPDPWNDHYPVVIAVGYTRKPESFEFYVGYSRDDNYTAVYSSGTTVYWSAVGY